MKFTLIAFFFLLSYNSYAQADTIKPVIDAFGRFPGGEAAWRSYMSKNLNPDVVTKNYAPPGSYRVVVEFFVDNDGNITRVLPLTDHGYGMEEEAIRVVSKGPKWLPLKPGSDTTKIYRKQPLTFQVTAEFGLSRYKLKAGESTTIELLGVDAIDENIIMSISKGSLSRTGPKKCLVSVDQPGYAVFTVWIQGKKKKEELGKIALRVE